MLKENIGSVSEGEKDQIKKLYERKLALNELLLSLENPSLQEEQKQNIYNKLVEDMGRTKTSFDKWWQDMSIKYKFKSINGGQWMIDFDTNQVFVFIEK
jgi:CXXX repeat modification system protein